MKTAILAFAFAYFAARLASGADWPQYRGPGASGLDDSAALPTTWDVKAGTNIRWQTPIPGLAHASPIIWGNRVYIATAVKPGESQLRIGLYGDIDSVTENQPQQWRLLALEKATGRSFHRDHSGRFCEIIASPIQRSRYERHKLTEEMRSDGRL